MCAGHVHFLGGSGYLPAASNMRRCRYSRAGVKYPFTDFLPLCLVSHSVFRYDRDARER